MFRQRLILTLAGSLICGLLHADDKPGGPDPAALSKSRLAAVAFLRTTQAEDGSWTNAQQPGISALVLTAILRSGVAVDDPTVQQALRHMESYVQPDGGIYHPKTAHKNYETSIALLAFQAANADQRYQKEVTAAVGFLKQLQWDEDDGQETTSPAYGGAGYGSHQRPDLSNTTFFLEALQTAGIGKEDPAMQKALLFVSRCQNLESEHNTLPFAAKVNDGGFYYTPAAGGNSQAGQTADGGLRSYASMTYAGLKSMIYAGVDQDDPRITAAREWIKKFYTLKENPGLGQQGLFYYYQTFAKTLSVMQVDQFEDAAGQKHDWRKELAEHLFSLQKENGSWLNPTDRWYEGDPNLVTAYALLALEHCGKRK